MSHEIRTPLNGVIGLAELLDDVPMSTDKRLVFDNMRRSARLLADLVSQVLDVAVADAGALKLAAEPLSIREALATVQAVFQRAAGERGLSFVAEVDAAVPERVMGDVVRIRQVLLNVLGNAMKFTESGAFHLRVSLRDRSPDRQELRVEVTDTGCGMTPLTVSTLFTAFSQGDTAASRHMGTGLGLFSTRQLVEAMGGTIAASSEVGLGSTFRFNLYVGVAEPLGRVEAAASAASAASAPSAASAASAAFLNARVLIAEDNPVNVLVAVGLLKRLGITPDKAENGREAVDLAALNDYDVVLMDLNMPELDGWQASRRILAEARDVTPVIVAMSATTDALSHDASEAAGIHEFLHKPIDFALMRSMFERLLRGRRPDPGSG